MDCNMLCLPVHHQPLELAQTHVHQVSNAIQPSHPLSSPSPPTLNLSLNQGLFKWVNFLHQVAEVLEFQLQHQSFQWIFRTDFLLELTCWISLMSKDSQESSPPQFKSISSSVLSFLYGPTLTSIHDYWWYEIGRGKSTCFPNTSLTRAMVTSPAPPVLRSLEFWLIPWPRGALSGEALHQL